MFHFLSRFHGFAPYNKCSLKRDRRIRLTLEVLENRLVPTTFIVNNLEDAGNGFFQDGIYSGDLRYCTSQLNANGLASNVMHFCEAHGLSPEPYRCNRPSHPSRRMYRLMGTTRPARATIALVGSRKLIFAQSLRRCPRSVNAVKWR